jgi:hypothetical protein
VRFSRRRSRRPKREQEDHADPERNRSILMLEDQVHLGEVLGTESPLCEGGAKIV